MIQLRKKSLVDFIQFVVHLKLNFPFNIIIDIYPIQHIKKSVQKHFQGIRKV